MGRLSGDLLHASGESLEAYLAKQNRYTTPAGRGAVRARRALFRGAAHRCRRSSASSASILRGGFLDGVAGLVHISIGCFNSFSKYAKLRALEQAQRDARS